MALATVELKDGHVAGGAEDVEHQKHAGDGNVDACGGGEAELGCETGVGGPVLDVLDVYTYVYVCRLIRLSYLCYRCSVHVVQKMSSVEAVLDVPMFDMLLHSDVSMLTD